MAQVKRIMISLPESLLAEVDIIVREEGKNRSEFIREAMRTYISEQHRRQLRERMRAGYEAMGEVNLSMAEEALAVDNDCLIRYEEALSEVEGA